MAHTFITASCGSAVLPAAAEARAVVWIRKPHCNMCARLERTEELPHFQELKTPHSWRCHLSILYVLRSPSFSL